MSWTTGGDWRRCAAAVLLLVVAGASAVEAVEVVNCTSSIDDDYFGSASYGVPADARCYQAANGRAALWVSPLEWQLEFGVGENGIKEAFAQGLDNMPDLDNGVYKRVVRSIGNRCYYVGVPGVASDAYGVQWLEGLLSPLDRLVGDCSDDPASRWVFVEISSQPGYTPAWLAITGLGLATLMQVTFGFREKRPYLKWTDPTDGQMKQTVKPRGHWSVTKTRRVQAVGAVMFLVMSASAVLMVSYEGRRPSISARDTFYAWAHVGGIIGAALVAARPYLRSSEPKYPHVGDDKDLLTSPMKLLSALAGATMAFSMLSCVWLMGEERAARPLGMVPMLMFASWAYFTFTFSPPRRPLPDGVEETTAPTPGAMDPTMVPLAQMGMVPMQQPVFVAAGGYPAAAAPPPPQYAMQPVGGALPPGSYVPGAAPAAAPVAGSDPAYGSPYVVADSLPEAKM